MRTRPLGSAIGAVAGLVFVLANSGGVPASPILRTTAVAWFLAIGWFVVLRGPEVEEAPPSPTAVRTYAVSVAAMVGAIPVGAAVITNVVDKPNAVPVWVVLAIGAHFWPFAHAFQLALFRWLSASLILIATVGAIPALISDSATPAAVTGTMAGFVLLTFSAVGPQLARSRIRFSAPST